MKTDTKRKMSSYVPMATACVNCDKSCYSNNDEPEKYPIGLMVVSFKEDTDEIDKIHFIVCSEKCKKEYIPKYEAKFKELYGDDKK